MAIAGRVERTQAETRSLAEVFAERKELIAKYVPAEIQTIHERAIAEVRDSGIAGRALHAGSMTPRILSFANQNGTAGSSFGFIAKGQAGGVFFSWTLVPILRWPTGSHECDLSANSGAGRRIGRHLPSNRHQSYLMADQHRFRFSASQ